MPTITHADTVASSNAIRKRIKRRRKKTAWKVNSPFPILLNAIMALLLIWILLLIPLSYDHSPIPNNRHDESQPQQEGFIRGRNGHGGVRKTTSPTLTSTVKVGDDVDTIKHINHTTTATKKPIKKKVIVHKRHQEGKNDTLKIEELDVHDDPIDVIKKKNWMRSRPPVYSSWLQYSPNGKRNKRRRKVVQLQQDDDSTSPMVYAVSNPWKDSTRYVCNIPIPPKSKITIDLATDDNIRKCLSSVQLGGRSSNNNNTTISFRPIFHMYHNYGDLKSQPPITVRFQPTIQPDNATKLVEGESTCDIPCWIQPVKPETLFYRATYDDLPFQFTKITVEGPDYYPAYEVDDDAWKWNEYYATTDFNSEIPLIYWSPHDVKLQNGFSPVNFDTAQKKASFLARNCNSKNNREWVVETMMKESLTNSSIPVDSIQACLHNTELPDGIDINNKTQILRQYLFHLAFENQRYPDYVTEKLWGGLESGTLLVYWGPPNIRDHLPHPDSVILYDDFNNDPIALAQYLTKISQNKTLYYEHHQWRSEPLSIKFQEKYEFAYTHVHCRYCRWGMAQKYGLPWDHSKQSIRPQHQIQRQTCISKTTGQIMQPFREMWDSDDNEMEEADIVHDFDCAYSDDDVLIDGSSHDKVILPFLRIKTIGPWKRIVYDHDGVTDITLEYHNEDGGNSLTLNSPVTIIRFGLPIVSEKFYTPPYTNETSTITTAGEDDVEYWMQNESSRITLLLSQPLKVELSSDIRDQRRQEMLIHIPQQHPTMIDLRFMVEDLDVFHKDAVKYETYFAATMSKDFFDPLEITQIQNKSL